MATRPPLGQPETKATISHVDNGVYPATLQSLVTRGSESNWRGPYLRDGKLPKDQWNNEFQYTVKENGIEIRSAGPDGQFGTSDDITN